MVKLEKYIYNLMDVLRGTVNSGEGSELVLRLVFAKVLSDAFKDPNNLKENIITSNLTNENNFDFSKLVHSDISVIDELEKGLYALERENSLYMDGIFTSFNISEKVKNLNLIYELICGLNDIDFSPYIDDGYKIGNLFLGLIHLLLKSSKGEFVTSSSITKLVAKLMEKEDIETIYDPAIGISGLAIETAKSHSNSRIFGQEINHSIAIINKMNLILNGFAKDIPNIELGDTLIHPKHHIGNTVMKFDCVVSAPPIGLKNWGHNELLNDRYNRFYRGLPSRGMGDYAFITHLVESMKENGVGVVLAPHGVLFRGGPEGEIREAFIKENIIHCVISLPSNMLYSTAIPTTLLIFKKNRSLEEVLFIDASNPEKKASKVNTVLSEEDINKIWEIYKDFKTVDKVSKVVSISDIIDNDYNLNISRYIDKHEREELDLNSLNKEIKYIQLELNEVQSKLNEILG